MMQRRGDSLVIVVNEYGGVMGMLTQEDVMEEVVGDIEDEFDEAEVFVKEVGGTRILVSSRIPIEQLNEVLPAPIPEGSYETLAGYLNFVLQRIPSEGDQYQIGDMRLVVTNGGEKGIEEVEIFV